MNITAQAAGRKSLAHFVMGSAQLGAPYGKLRKFSFPTHDEAILLIRRAVELGVTVFDTARNYGEAEIRLGAALDSSLFPFSSNAHVFTKLHPMQHLPADLNEHEARKAVDESISISLRSLRVKRLPVVMLHLAYLRNAWNGAAWARLLELQTEGLIGELGLSAVTPQEALRFLDEPVIKHIQIPINILDPRWEKLDAARKFNERSDVTVHARSVFLQGVLLHNEVSGWPSGFTDAQRLIAWLNQLARRLTKGNVPQLAISYLRGLGWLDGLVIGVENETQLTENLKLFDSEPFDADVIAEIQRSRPVFDEWLLDPGNW